LYKLPLLLLLIVRCTNRLRAFIAAWPNSSQMIRNIT